MSTVYTAPLFIWFLFQNTDMLPVWQWHEDGKWVSLSRKLPLHISKEWAKEGNQSSVQINNNYASLPRLHAYWKLNMGDVYTQVWWRAWTNAMEQTMKDVASTYVRTDARVWTPAQPASARLAPTCTPPRPQHCARPPTPSSLHPISGPRAVRSSLTVLPVKHLQHETLWYNIYVWHKWNIWNILLQHICETYEYPDKTLATCVWNMCNIQIKHLEHVCETSTTSR
jgi:hypothetical protein